MLIKIDEVSNLGAVRIRLRSLKAAVSARRFKVWPAEITGCGYGLVSGICAASTPSSGPDTPIHFELIEEALVGRIPV